MMRDYCIQVLFLTCSYSYVQKIRRPGKKKLNCNLQVNLSAFQISKTY
jgi:hypothetical protein